MFSRSRVSAIFLAIIFALSSLPSAGAQAPGYADITYPQQGMALFGLVTIEGSAAHPSFDFYELSFAFQPNPTDTWFPILLPIQTPVTEGRLGIWDTTGITDGDYQLRLRVWLKNGNALEAIVLDLRIRNTTPTETPSADKPAPIPSPSPIMPTAIARETSIPPSTNDGSSRVWRVFAIGGGIGAAILMMLGGYLFIRKSMRLRWATLRMRQIHWKTDHSRGRRRTRRR